MAEFKVASCQRRRGLSSEPSNSDTDVVRDPKPIPILPQAAAKLGTSGILTPPLRLECGFSILGVHSPTHVFLTCVVERFWQAGPDQTIGSVCVLDSGPERFGLPTGSDPAIQDWSATQHVKHEHCYDPRTPEQIPVPFFDLVVFHSCTPVSFELVLWIILAMKI